jgi:2-polyprenyl-6-methoxyphenol hydroxylase-like FAD-dependent oxidoreductase
VAIAGGGPVGLMLACELELAGVSVLVLERLTEIDPTVKAGSINLPTAGAFYRRGLLAPLEEQQRLGFERMRSFLRQQNPGPDRARVLSPGGMPDRGQVPGRRTRALWMPEGRTTRQGRAWPAADCDRTARA